MKVVGLAKVVLKDHFFVCDQTVLKQLLNEEKLVRREIQLTHI